MNKGLVIILVILPIPLMACTSPNKAASALQDAGYSDITINGIAPFSCGEDDNFSNKFTATNPAGDTVSGVVCCGILKGCTIRH